MESHSKAESLRIWTGPGNEIHKKTYGQKVLVTRMGKINIIHTDQPSEKTIRKRIDEVLHEEIDGNPYDDDCPLCQQFKDGPYDVVY